MTFLLILLILSLFVITYSVYTNIQYSNELKKLNDLYNQTLEELNELKEEKERFQRRTLAKERSIRLAKVQNEKLFEISEEQFDPIETRKDLYIHKVVLESNESDDFYQIFKDNLQISDNYCYINRAELARLFCDYDKIKNGKFSEYYMNIAGRYYITNKGIEYVSTFKRVRLILNDIVNNQLVFGICPDKSVINFETLKQAV